MAEPPSETGDISRLERVAAAFGAVDKATRGLRLYEGRGPNYERLLDEVLAKTEAMLALGEVTVRLAPFGLVYAGKPLTEEEKRVAYLFRMFCDGIRELTVLPGIARAELEALIALFASDRRSGDEDMVTRLWKAELAHVRYYAVDSFNAGALSGMENEEDLSLLGTASRIEQDQGGGQTTLSSDDVRILRGDDGFRWMATASAPATVRGPQVESLRKDLHAPPDFARFVGIGLRAAERSRGRDGGVAASPLVIGVLDGTLLSGDVDIVAGLLGVLVGAAKSGEAGAALLAAAVSPERVRRLREVYLKAPDRFLPFFGTIVGPGRDGLVALLSDLPPGAPQVSLRSLLLEKGIDLTPFYASRLADADEGVVLDAVQSLGTIGSPEALKAVGQALRSDRSAVRTAALRALDGRYVVDSRMEIGRALRDPVKENRLLALGIVRSCGDARMGWTVLATVEDLNFPSKDVAEQATFYEALASFRDNRTLGHFSKVLNEKNLLRSKAVVAQQLMCVRALATVGTPEAGEILARARSSWFLPAEVKSAASSAARTSGG